MNFRITFPLLALIGILTSCKSRYKIQPYSLNRSIQVCDSCEQRKIWASNPTKSIVLVSDSTLNYTKSYAGLGASTTIKYRIVNDTLTMESYDVYGKNMTENNADFSNLYLYNKDSLTGLNNNEKYYSKYYLKSKRKKGFEQFYFIIDGQKYKMTSRRNAIRFVKKLDSKNEYRVLEKKIAKLKYGISEEFLTFILKE